jgi:hypothetical protein
VEFERDNYRKALRKISELVCPDMCLNDRADGKECEPCPMSNDGEFDRMVLAIQTAREALKQGEPLGLRQACPFPETEDEYNESSMVNGGHCPNCGNPEPGYRNVDFEAAAIYQDVTCNSCGFQFYDKYHLAGYEESPDYPPPLLQGLMQAAMEAEEYFGVDVLEEYAKKLRDAPGDDCPRCGRGQATGLDHRSC